MLCLGKWVLIQCQGQRQIKIKVVVKVKDKSTRWLWHLKYSQSAQLSLGWNFISHSYWKCERNVANFPFTFSHRGHVLAILLFCPVANPSGSPLADPFTEQNNRTLDISKLLISYHTSQNHEDTTNSDDLEQTSTKSKEMIQWSLPKRTSCQMRNPTSTDNYVRTESNSVFSHFLTHVPFKWRTFDIIFSHKFYQLFLSSTTISEKGLY
jgi:hypothetical protein